MEKKVVKNTLVLSIRILLSTGITIYSVRLVLEILGAEDFGLFNVVGGVVALLEFLPNSMAAATQRYFSFAIGEGDREKLIKIFNASWIVYLSLGLLAILALKTIGSAFISGTVKIPAERVEAALALYNVSVWTFFLNILTSPFRAVITAHEDMHLYAGISILEVFLKLAGVLALKFILFDRLAAYGFVLFGVSLLIGCTYVLFCVNRYEECRFSRSHVDSGLVREMVGFTGWTLFGQLTTVARNQAVTILVNQMFNPIVVAARAIALNVASQTNILASNFNTSLYPPIIKAYAAGDRVRMYGLVYGGSKITIYLIWVLAVPIFIYLPLILSLWLKNPPGDTVLFTRLALIDAMIGAASLPLMTAARAPGKMRGYELILGSIQVAVFGASWIVLAKGGAAYSVMVVSIIASILMFGIRLGLVHMLTGIPVGQYLRQVMLPAARVAVVSSLLCVSIAYTVPGGVGFALASIIIQSIVNVITIYYFGLDPEWQLNLRGEIQKRWRNIWK